MRQISERLAQTLGHNWRWIRPLARRYVKLVADKARLRERDVVKFLEADEAFQCACVRHRKRLRVQNWIAPQQELQPVPAAIAWELPAIESIGDLAEWLAVSAEELAWFADLKMLGSRNPNGRLRHYHYRILNKIFGSVRLIEAPKPRLKQLQRQIPKQIIEKVAAHPACTASPTTWLSQAISGSSGMLTASLLTWPPFAWTKVFRFITVRRE